MQDIIIIGAGAAGLFAAASNKVENGLIIEKNSEAGKKLLITGSGQCNITHGGDIKDFLSKYGDNGKKIRTPLYKMNNKMTMEAFEKIGVKCFTREDDKVFPESLSAKDVRDKLEIKAKSNNFKIKYNEEITSVCKDDQGFLLNNKYRCKKLIFATGGSSYPKTGSDGKIFSQIKDLGVNIVDLKPALAPIFVENYPFTEISGVSFENINIKLLDNNKVIKKVRDDVLFTHTSLSGPAILTLSRWAKPGMILEFDFCPEYSTELKGQKENKAIENYICSETKITKSFCEVVLKYLKIEKGTKTSMLPGKDLKKIKAFLKSGKFSISGTGGFNTAMVTAGGVDISEVSMKTMEHKDIENLYFIGEVLNVDGDTGGYNLQFAFSSAYACSNSFTID